MKDQITALMEALRLSRDEIEKFRRGRKDVQRLQATVGAIEAILSDPVVARAINTIEPLIEAPGLVPDKPSRAREEV